VFKFKIWRSQDQAHRIQDQARSPRIQLESQDQDKVQVKIKIKIKSKSKFKIKDQDKDKDKDQDQDKSQVQGQVQEPLNIYSKRRIQRNHRDCNTRTLNQ